MQQREPTASFNNKENVEMRGQSNGVRFPGQGSQFNTTQMANSQTAPGQPSALNKTTSFLSTAGATLANNMN
jgi:hypothetical protein